MALDVTTLGIVVDSTQVNKAKRDLDGLTDSAKNTERQIKVLKDGTKAYTDEQGRWRRENGQFISSFEKLKNGINDTQSSFLNLGNAIGAVSAVMVASKLAHYADTMSLVNARLSLVTNSTQELVNAQKQLFNISQNTRQSLEDTTELYTRIARATQNLGKSQSDTLEVTEAINKAIIISGSSAESAKAALIQLGQGFASGTLRGEELNSVLEQTPRVAQMIADGLGVTIGQLRKMGAEGQLTSEAVFSALMSQSQIVNKEFTKMPLTISQSITVAQNEIMKLVGDMDKATGASSAVANAIVSLSKNITDIAGGMITAAGATWAIRAAFIGAAEGAGIATLAVRGLNGAIALLARNPVMVAALAAGGLIAYVMGKDGDTKPQVSKQQEALNQQNQQIANLRANLTKLDAAYKNGAISKEVYSKAVANTTKELKKAGDEIDKIEGKYQPQKLATKKSKSEITAEERALKKQQREALAAQKKGARDYKSQQKELYEFYQWADEENTQYYEKQRVNASAVALAEIDLRKQYISLQEDGIDKSIALERLAHQERLENLNVEIAKRLQDGTLTVEQANKYYELEDTRHKKTLENIEMEHSYLKNMFDTVLANMEKALDEMMLGALSGKKVTVTNFFSSLGEALGKGASRTIAGGITDSLKGGVQNIFKTMGGLGTSSLFGSSGTISSTSLGDLISSGKVAYNEESGTYTGNGIEVSKSGSIIQDSMGTLNNVSTAKSIYGAATGGLSTSIMAYGNQGLVAAYNAGLIGEAGLTTGTNFVAGFANPSTFAGSGGAAGYGAMTAGALGGAAGGYALGSIGDQLFGAKTQAANYGAIGGAIGGIAGSIVPGIGTVAGAAIGAAIGSAIGGAFGSAKKAVTAQGIEFNQDINEFFVSGQNFADITKTYKSWFRSKTTRWTEFTSLTEEQVKQITLAIGQYDRLLEKMGDVGNITIKAGRYTSEQFTTAVEKGFLSSFMEGASQSAIDSVYGAWQKYATDINKSVTQAMIDTINQSIASKRSYTEWYLNFSGKTNDALQFTADYIKKDLLSFEEAIGATGVTIDNYLTLLEEQMKAGLTPEMLSNWEKLGLMLQQSAEATKKAAEASGQLTEAQKEAESQSKMMYQDMMLQNTKDASKLFESIDLSNQENKKLFVDMTDYMRRIWTNQQFGVQI